MNAAGSLLGAAVAVTAITIAGANAPHAAAYGEEWGLNGVYVATSNGEWAKTNEVYRDEASVRSTWTIQSRCSYVTECTGTVTSDLGWTAPISQQSGVWRVKRTVPNWEPCPDGTAAEGFQVYRFAAMTPDGTAKDPTSTVLLGSDQTTGPSGACGINKQLLINMPFKLVKQG